MDISEQGEQGCWCSYLTMLCFIVGFIRLVRILVAFLRPFLNRRADLYKRYGGGWVLVTGGSEGIGYSIAQQLAKQKFNIILVSRSLSKLQTASEKLKKANPSIEVIVKSIDFEKIVTKDQYQLAFSQLIQKDISILVNNVGYYLPYNFTSVPFEELRRQMKINCLPIAVLSKMFIQKMEKRQSKSGIINLSSAASTTSYKGSEHYSATKRFDDYLSQALAYQYSNKIDILTARPFIVTSTMTRNVDSFINTTCQKSAKAIVDSLSKRKIVYGPFIHNIQSLGPEFIFSPIVEHIFTKGVQSFRSSYDKQV